MNIGFSLQSSYVLDLGTDVVKSGFFQWMGEPLTFLAELRRNGVRSVELQGVAPGFSDASVLAAMQRIYVAGLQFSCHSGLPGGDKKDEKAALAAFVAPPQADIRTFLNALGASPVMVVHPYGFPDVSYDELVTATVDGLRVLIKNLKQHAMPFRVALEINRYRGANTPGVSYEGLLEIGGHFSDKDLGFCWDMGHTQASFLLQQLPKTPPPEFLSRVIHTHIHDVSPEGGTHHPLRPSSPYLEKSIRCLETSGYTGIYNLELYPDRWEPEVKVKDAALFSIERLGTILRR